MLAKLRYDPSDEDIDWFCDGVSGAGPFTQLNTATPDGLAHQVSVKNNTANSHAGKNVTIVGTDADGNAISESITGPAGNATVETTKYYLTVASVTPSATIGADTFDVGFVDEFVSATIPLDWRRNVPSHFFLDVTGTISLDVDFAIQDPGIAAEQSAIKWVVVSSSLDDETADSSAFVDITAGYTAFRARVNSYSSGAEFTLYASQPEVV